MEQHPAFELIDIPNARNAQKFEERLAAFLAFAKAYLTSVVFGLVGILTSVIMVVNDGFTVATILPGVIAVTVSFAFCAVLTYKNFKRFSSFK